jgi:uncharacterized membrane protein
MRAYAVEILAVGFFIIEWTVYAVTLEHAAYGHDSLSARVHVYREVWIRRLLDREARMVDMQIMASLQNGTAFFASTSLFAVGGASRDQRSAGRAGRAAGRSQSLACALGSQMSRADPDFRLHVLQVCLGVPAVQLRRHPARGDAAGLATRHARGGSACHQDDESVEATGRQFNRGQRAFFFALGYLGWFVSPCVLFVTTAAVVIVTWRSQFASNAWRAMGS